MTEQDDLFAKAKEQQRVTDETSAVPVDAGGGGVGAGEVRTVAPPAAPRASSLWLLLLLLVIVIAGGYLLIAPPSATQQNQAPAAVSVPKKLPIPERQVQTEAIKPNIVEAQAVVVPSPLVEENPVAVSAPPASPALTVAEPVVAPVAVPVAPAAPVTLHSVLVGPFLSKSDLAEASKQLERLGFEPQPRQQGRGIVSMTRLREGLYPEAQARQRLAQLQKSVRDAFILPSGDKRALYVGSFTSVARATEYAAELDKKGIKVTQMTTDVEMNGSMLLAVEAAPDIARQAAELIGKSGLKTQIQPK